MTSKRDDVEPQSGAANAFGRRSFLKGRRWALAPPSLDWGASGAVAATPSEISWDDEVDVLIIGAGAAGLTAAIAARDLGVEVLVVEANFDTGGRAIISGGGVYLGGGTSLQTISGWTTSRGRIQRLHPRRPPVDPVDDRDLAWAYAQNSPATYDFLVRERSDLHELRGPRPDGYRPTTGVSTGMAQPDRGHCPWGRRFRVMRPLQNQRARQGRPNLLQHRMIEIHREEPTAGRVLGITAIEVDDWYEPTLRSRLISRRARG